MTCQGKNHPGTAPAVPGRAVYGKAIGIKSLSFEKMAGAASLDSVQAHPGTSPHRLHGTHHMARALRLLLVFPLAGLLIGCASAETPWVELKGKRFQVEIADDDAERARGLMFRDAMAADHGMLFIHEDEEPQSYWMKNTKIPLDILYFDRERKLVSAAVRRPALLGRRPVPAVPEHGQRLVRPRTQCWRGAGPRCENRRRPGVRPRGRREEIALDLAAAEPHIGSMRSHYALPDWNSLSAYGDDELPLLDTALLIARDEYPRPRPRPVRIRDPGLCRFACARRWTRTSTCRPS